MTVGYVAHLTPLVRDYLAPPAPAPVPAPPLPTPAPPPSGTAPTFNVSAVGRIGATRNVALTPLDIATITSGQTATPLVRTTGLPAGLAVNLTFNTGTGAGSLALSGTPTAAGTFRLTVTYVRASDNIVLGSSIHEIVVVDPARVVTVGIQNNQRLRVGRTVAGLTLSQLTANWQVLVTYRTASPPIPGLTLSMAWFPGFNTSGTFTGVNSWGELRIGGTPAEAGTFTVNASYYDGTTLVATSVHTIIVDPADAAPAPPAPAPAPIPAPPPVTAPAPSPPAPAPAPTSPPDPLFASVRALMAFDTKTTGWREEIRNVLWTGDTATIETGAAANAAGTGPLLGSEIAYNLADSDLSHFELYAGPATVEIWAKVESDVLWEAPPEEWDYLATRPRWMPMVTCLDAARNIVWSLGLASVVGGERSFDVRLVRPALWRAMRNRTDGSANQPLFVFGPAIPNNDRAFWHLAAQWGYGASAVAGAWVQGRGGAAAIGCPTPGTGVPLLSGTRFVLGGADKAPPGYTVVRMRGAIDEFRLTAAERYSYSGGFTSAINDAARRIPWPRY